MTDTDNDLLAPVAVDAVLSTAQETGKLPVHWWTSDACWQMLAKLSKQFSNSTMVPPSFRNEPGNVLVALAAGMPLGLSPLACLQSIAVINGKPTLYGDAVIAQVLASPDLLSIAENATGTVEDGNRTWTITLNRRLKSGKQQQVQRTFSVDDAKRAGLWGKQGPWKQYPDRMLYNRARTLAVRDTFADVLQGTTLAADRDEVIKDVTAEIKPAETEVIAPLTEATTLAPADAGEPESKVKPKKARKKRTKKAIEKMVADAAPQRGVVQWHGLFHKLLDADAPDGAVSYAVDAQEIMRRHEGVWGAVQPGEGSFYNACYEMAHAALIAHARSLWAEKEMSRSDILGYLIREHGVNTDAIDSPMDLNVDTLAAVVDDLT